MSDIWSMKIQNPYQNVPVEKIQITEQTRKTFDEKSIQLLADDINQNGIIEPLVVWQDGPRYHLISGERRLRAARLLGLPNVPVIVRHNADLLEVQLAENLLREALTPTEISVALNALKQSTGLTVRRLAERYNLSTTTAHRRLKNLSQNGTESEKPSKKSLPSKQEFATIKSAADGTVRFALVLQTSDSSDAIAKKIHDGLLKLLQHLNLDWQGFADVQQRSSGNDRA
jgi:ParB/RepB/Spo0J family partition protein